MQIILNILNFENAYYLPNIKLSKALLLQMHAKMFI